MTDRSWVSDRGGSPGAALTLERLVKRFGSVLAVDRVSLEIPSGGFVTLLGPSGSGKTTTLNLIAGFLQPDAGEIFFDGRPISRTPTHRRDLGMVFQHYALFPHMSVFQNVAFPLRMRARLSKAELTRRVEATLALVQLSGLGGRYPRQLSGGQQQRVAMARALVSRPRLLLMDEPLEANCPSTRWPRHLRENASGFTLVWFKRALPTPLEESHAGTHFGPCRWPRALPLTRLAGRLRHATAAGL